ncbi:MAG: glutamate racemase [Clostridia bacterium]|nr:glutamate racemase [Clostridia bacterium]
MDKRPIGVFDSGLGGLTAVRQILKRLPNENVVYFGDTGRVPYGTRGEAVIEKYAKEDCDFLLQHDVKFVIAACGTVSSVAPHILASLPVPAIGVVEPSAKAAANATENGKIGILGTSATINSGSFVKALKAVRPQTEFYSQPCPLFIPLVENGWIHDNDPITTLTVERYLKPFKEAGVDTIILGCTHFPLLSSFISRYMGNDVTLIDAGEEAAKACEEQLKALSLENTDGSGQCQYFVSDHPKDFAQIAEIFLGKPVQEQVKIVDLNTL